MARRLANSERGSGEKYREASEKGGGQVKNVIAMKVPGESDDAK